MFHIFLIIRAKHGVLDTWSKLEDLSTNFPGPTRDQRGGLLIIATQKCKLYVHRLDTSGGLDRENLEWECSREALKLHQELNPTSQIYQRLVRDQAESNPIRSQNLPVAKYWDLRAIDKLLRKFLRPSSILPQTMSDQ